MPKTILITGSTDGIGLLTAKRLADEGHTVLLHGRSAPKLAAAADVVGGRSETYCADLSDPEAVKDLASEVRARRPRLDVLINNAGVFQTPNPVLKNGLDIRFAVNTFAPYVLTRRLLATFPQDGRVVNLSSAAQAPVDLDAMQGKARLGASAAYAQSKLALTIWTRELARELPKGPSIIAVNPSSFLASKMVKEAYGVEGNDMSIGVDILCDAALGARFANAAGEYFDNDKGQFSQPHRAALDAHHASAVMQVLQRYAAEHG